MSESNLLNIADPMLSIQISDSKVNLPITTSLIIFILSIITSFQLYQPIAFINAYIPNMSGIQIYLILILIAFCIISIPSIFLIENSLMQTIQLSTFLIILGNIITFISFYKMQFMSKILNQIGFFNYAMAWCLIINTYGKISFTYFIKNTVSNLYLSFFIENRFNILFYIWKYIRNYI